MAKKMNRSQKINLFSEQLKSSNGVLLHEIKIYKSTTQAKIRALIKDDSLDIDKLAELILIRKKEIDPDV